MKSEIDKKLSERAFLGVSLIIIAQAVFCFIWLKQNSFPLWFDYGGYYKKSIEIYRSLDSGMFSFLQALFSTQNPGFIPYRILLPLSSVPWYFIFGLNAHLAVLSTTSFMALALFSLYCLAVRIFDRATAFFAVFVLATSPGFFIYYRRYSPEFAATALVALAAYFLYRCENFHSRKFSLLAGIAFGLGILAKEMAFAFVVGIVLYLFFQKGDFKRDKNFFANLFLFSFTALALVFPFYWPHLKNVTKNIFQCAYSRQMAQRYSMVEAYNLQGILFYLRANFKFLFLPFYFFWALFGTLLLLKKKITDKRMLFFWLASSYIILCTTQTRAPEYALPLLIPLSLIAAYGINNISRNKFLKAGVFLLVLGWGVGQFLFLSFPFSWLPEKGALRQFGVLNMTFPNKEDWKLGEIIDYLEDNLRKGQRRFYVHLGANLFAFSPMTLGYVALEKNLPLEFYG
ncbi:MAG: glycosyltransferase family 39 protein, partial [Candidatus Omnitrophica bacterium]|nr:glycosyltransferase family 39 protein [Candidatus Omnitrophota bacterium]